MKIIDFHTHVYPDQIARKASDSIAAFYGMPVRRDGTLSCLLKEGEVAGVDFRVICSVAVSPSRVCSINDYLLRTVSENPGRVLALAGMHPGFDGARAELERVKALGMPGLKLHPDIQAFQVDSPEAVKLLKEAAKAGMFALLHTGDHRFDYSGPERVARLLDRVPELKAVCAHLGGWSEWDQAAKLLRGRENLWVDTSSSLYAMSPGEAVDRIRAFGAEHVLFGTDYPMWDTEGELERFGRLPLGAEEREQILHRNAEALLGMADTNA